ncbi:MAG: hypothetical protein KGL39_44565 [Patescibacteria group bacterium]|nr:hypothetical protein [Patescibacteria group bacterium]
MTDLQWLTVEEVAGFEQISAKQVRRRTKLGSQPALIARYEERQGGCPVLKIDPSSMTFDAQQRYRQRALKDMVHGAEETTKKAARSGAEDQSSLFPQTAMDQAVEQARDELAPSQFSVAMQRFKIVQPLVNHDFMAVSFQQTGFKKKMDYSMSMARASGVSYRSIRRWRQEFESVLKDAGAKEAFIALADERPGPERGTTALDNSMKAFVLYCWIKRKLTRRQTCRALVSYLEEKQRGCGARWAYEIPSDSTVCRFINAPEPYGLGGDSNPLRVGPDSVKESFYIDRTFDDELVGEAWCTDEFEIDGYPYDDDSERVVYNYGKGNPVLHLELFIDERTTFIMDWELTSRIDEDTLNLAERMLRKYWVPKRLVSDRAHRFRELSRGRVIVRPSGDLCELLSGPLGTFGVKPRESEDKNPQGNRLERLHGVLADLCRRDFSTTCWRPPKKVRDFPGKDVRAIVGIDQRVQDHLKYHCGKAKKSPRAGEPSKLLPLSKVRQIVAGWIDEINDAATDAKGCHGLTRRAAFNNAAWRPSAEEIERRRVTEAEIDEAFAENREIPVRKAGILQWPDGLRYWSPELTGRDGELMACKRLRRDRSKIFVEDAGSVIVAARRAAVGTNDAEALARESEKLARLQKLYSRMNGVPSLENAPAQDPAADEMLQSAQDKSVKEGRPEPMTVEAVPLPDSDREPSGIGFADLE